MYTVEEKNRFTQKFKVNLKTDCYEWTAYVCDRGYGQVNVHSIKREASRVAWEMVYGKIPDGLYVCHHCDNRLCVNVGHLFLGTALDNHRDCINKGRRVEPGKFLTREQVIKIFHAPGLIRDIAKEFGTTSRHVTRIRNKERWKKLLGQEVQLGRPKLSAAEKARRKAERETGAVQKPAIGKSEEGCCTTAPSVEAPRDMFLTQKVLELSIICNQLSQKIDAVNAFVNTMQSQINQALQNLVNRLQVLEKEVLPPPLVLSPTPPMGVPSQSLQMQDNRPVQQDMDSNHVVNERDDLGLT